MHLEKKDQRTKIPQIMSNCIESIYWTLLGIAGTKERNFLIDDYNHSPDGRKMTLKNFPGFQKKAVVFLPPLAEIQQRFTKSTEKRMTEEKFNEMLASFSIPRKIGLTFSDIQYIDTKAPEDIVNEYRSFAKQNAPPSPIRSLSKSTELPVSTSSYPNSVKTSQPVQSLSSSLPLYTNTSISSGHTANYYPNPYARKNEPVAVQLPLRTLPNYPERQFLNPQMRYGHYHPYPHAAYHGGMKLSRSDYYIPSKHTAQYDYKRMPYIIYPNQYAPYN